jgi:hypothetical protein
VNESAILWPLGANQQHSFEDFSGLRCVAYFKPRRREDREWTQKHQIVRRIHRLQDFDGSFRVSDST